MTVTLKKKYSNSLNPQFTEEYQVLVDAVKVFQEELKIKQHTIVLLKKKAELFGSIVGTTFYNSAVNKISCHIYVHRHSTTLGTLIVIAHEMVHAWQRDTKQPGKQKTWERQAEELSLAMVAKLHIQRYPNKPEAMLRGEVKLARVMLH